MGSGFRVAGRTTELLMISNLLFADDSLVASKVFSKIVLATYFLSLLALLATQRNYKEIFCWVDRR